MSEWTNCEICKKRSTDQAFCEGCGGTLCEDCTNGSQQDGILLDCITCNH